MRHHPRTCQSINAHPGVQGSKFSGGLHLGHLAIKSPQRQLQKASEHDFTEQCGVNLIVVVLQLLLRRQNYV